MLDLTTIQEFHLVRPWWLITLIPIWLLVWAHKYRQQWQSSWHKFIDPTLLAPLLKGKINKPSNIFPLMLLLFWSLSIFALAGPTWHKLPQPVKKMDNALVILLDLSPSMLAADVKPARLVAARHKIIDLLTARKEGYTALVAYSGDAHVVAPLTDDNDTIINLVNVLEPAIMPIDGSNLEHALQKSIQLFQNSGYIYGDILLLTDGITEQARHNSSKILSSTNFTLSIIGVGTEEGGPIPSNRGGFIKDEKGDIIMPSLNSPLLQSLADDTSGSYIPLQLSDKDISPLIDGLHRPDQTKSKTIEREFDQWQDMGAFLVWPLLILVLLAFRRGVILSLLFMIPLLPVPAARAEDSTWGKLWLNDNQRAINAMEQQDFEKASQLFNDKDWKASAQYQNKDYGSALERFKENKSFAGYYNQANALAKSGNLNEAIDSYQEAIKLKPNFEDAIYNKKIVEDLLKSEENQSPSSEQNKSSDQQKSNQPQQNESQENNNPTDNARVSPDQKRQVKSNEKQSAGENQSEKKSSDRNQEENSKQKYNPEPNANSSQNEPGTPNSEEKQAMEQWLRKVPDDPSSLLRNKFEYYYQQQLRQQQRGASSPYLNKEQRW